jgi:hypothetical protein
MSKMSGFGDARKLAEEGSGETIWKTYLWRIISFSIFDLLVLIY